MGFFVCVAVGVLDVSFEPVGSGGFGGVEVLCRWMGSKSGL